MKKIILFLIPVIAISSVSYFSTKDPSIKQDRLDIINKIIEPMDEISSMVLNKKFTSLYNELREDYYVFYRVTN